VRDWSASGVEWPRHNRPIIRTDLSSSIDNRRPAISLVFGSQETQLDTMLVIQRSPTLQEFIFQSGSCFKHKTAAIREPCCFALCRPGSNPRRHRLHAQASHFITERFLGVLASVAVWSRLHSLSAACPGLFRRVRSCQCCVFMLKDEHLPGS
jgi:hypothetical protein